MHKKCSQIGFLIFLNLFIYFFNERRVNEFAIDFRVVNGWRNTPPRIKDKAK